ncbi:hypothetical protein KM043_007199 [Ampulex compressa]|nr:hypothetical protein KM043_007199 [Ampulex compressa]
MVAFGWSTDSDLDDRGNDELGGIPFEDRPEPVDFAWRYPRRSVVSHRSRNSDLHASAGVGHKWLHRRNPIVRLTRAPGAPGNRGRGRAGGAAEGGRRRWGQGWRERADRRKKEQLRGEEGGRGGEGRKYAKSADKTTNFMGGRGERQSSLRKSRENGRLYRKMSGRSWREENGSKEARVKASRQEGRSCRNGWRAEGSKGGAEGRFGGKERGQGLPVGAG